MTAKKDPAAKAAPVRKRITASVIRKKAHEIYRKRVKEGIDGDADSDWLQAEKELKN
jgi:hypothetical protein